MKSLLKDLLLKFYPNLVVYKTEKINCLFCDSNQSTTFSKMADIQTCSNCGIVYLRTRPTEQTMYQLYQTYSNETSHMFPPNTIAATKLSVLRRKYLVEEIIGLNDKKGVWLDVGCGWGALLDEARDHAYTPIGIELARNCLDFANMQLRIPVSNSQFLDSKIDNNSCSIVSMVHVLEHLPYPKQTLEKLYNVLEVGGMFCGIVPNIESICAEYMKDGWAWLDPQHHYVHYSPKTLTDALKKAGFTIVKMYTTSGDFDYNTVINCMVDNIAGVTLIDAAKALLPQLEANGKGEEIRFFARKDK